MNEKSKKQYLERAGYLVAEFERFVGASFVDELFVSWLIDVKRQSVSPGTWRVYRNAAKLVVTEAAALERLKKTRPAKTKRDLLLKQTSSNRFKGLSSEDLEAIRSWAKSNGGEMAGVMIVWLEATLVTGLRPTEWMRTEIVVNPDNPQTYSIRAHNLKMKTDAGGIVQGVDDKHGRTHQVTRTIDLSHCSPSEFASVSKMVELGGLLYVMEHGENGKEGAFKEFYARVADTMHQATRTALGDREKYPTIYSARHQFASNLKASYKKLGYKPEQSRRMIAILMGQGSPKTSTYSYGLTRRGDDERPSPKPQQDEYNASFGALGDKH